MTGVGMVRKEFGVTMATSWPNRVSEATVWVKVVTTPLVCGDHASADDHDFHSETGS